MGLRILIVDDQLALAEMLADTLRERGYDAVAVSSGREAAARLEAEPFDAVVTDLRMPGLDGLGLLAISRRLNPRRPVIVMQAPGGLEATDAADYRLVKPFKVEELAGCLARALS